MKTIAIIDDDIHMGDKYAYQRFFRTTIRSR